MTNVYQAPPSDVPDTAVRYVCQTIFFSEIFSSHGKERKISILIKGICIDSSGNHLLLAWKLYIEHTEEHYNVF